MVGRKRFRARKRRTSARRRYEKGWIQSAIKHPGALREYVKRYYGARGFDSRGRIKVSLLRQLAKRNDHVGKMARMALTLRRFH